jgi:predicted LPLAT superfamily acyltransferase
MLAMTSGAPIFVFFALRTRGRHYHFCASEPIFIDAADRAERDMAVPRAAQQYADLLGKTVRRYPFQWHHFEPFIRK